MQTERQRIIEFLTGKERDVREISQGLGLQEKEVYDHLEHIARSINAQGGRLKVRPSECLKCGFVFADRQRFTRPGRCPKCRKSHIRSAGFLIEYYAHF